MINKQYAMGNRQGNKQVGQLETVPYRFLLSSEKRLNKKKVRPLFKWD